MPGVITELCRMLVVGMERLRLSMDAYVEPPRFSDLVEIVAARAHMLYGVLRQRRHASATPPLPRLTRMPRRRSAFSCMRRRVSGKAMRMVLRL